jgi:tryptophan halogenase
VGQKVVSKTVVVVGGGTAGWLTALMAKKSQPNLNITVVESKEIGILGAGEGSTPHLNTLFEYLGIPISDLVKNCDATIKNGIKFTNWNNDGDFFYHGFPAKDMSLGPNFSKSPFVANSTLLTISILLNNGLKQVDFTEKISEDNKVPFVFKSHNENDPTLSYDNISSTSIHFNASKLANRLKEIGQERGINVIDGIIKEVLLDDQGNIKSLDLEKVGVIDCNFVFDCSGFHRLIIGKTFNSKWKSYSDFLPSDSAVPFFIDVTDEIPPYTEAIAMKYGWMWKIPLQNRFGCGYVYDSSLISEEQAVEEIEDFLGYVPTYPRKDKGGFKFSAGYFEEPWIKNCVAVGLSANFIEPLEATSIWVSIIGLSHIFGTPDWIKGGSDEIRNQFNSTIASMNDDIASFIYFHYMTKRQDTEFWKKFSYENAPEDLKKRIDLWRNRLPNKTDNGERWSPNSWFIIGSFQETINKSIASIYIDGEDDYKKGLDMYNYFVGYQKSRASKCVSHNEFLEALK